VHSLRILLADLIDYAGLFPPAALDLAATLQAYAAAYCSQDSWRLGRYVLPAPRLEEFEAALAGLERCSEDDAPWRVTVIAGPEPEADLLRIAHFNQRHRDRIVIDAYEQNIPASIADTMRHISPDLTAYFEVPVTQLERVAEVAQHQARAKLRTGGLTPESFPTTSAVLAFLNACATHHVPFKATAGLHHALPGVRPLTYASDSPRGPMHGFLNLFLAAAGVLHGWKPESLTALLEETEPMAFRFDDQGVAWRGYHLDNGQLAMARAFALSFGCCSFEEPVRSMQTLEQLWHRHACPSTH